MMNSVQIKWLTIAVSLDDPTKTIRVNPVFPIGHLVSLTRFDLTTSCCWKVLDGSERDWAEKKTQNYVKVTITTNLF